jgi:hypothetical protein
MSSRGVRVDSDDLIRSAAIKSPILHDIVAVTGTQLQTGATAEIYLMGTPFPGTIVPIGWTVFFDHAGGTDFTVNTTLQLTNTEAMVYGEATNAISGSSDRYTVGSIISGGDVPGAGQALELQVKTGNPTGGHAAATALIHIVYMVI